MIVAERPSGLLKASGEARQRSLGADDPFEPLGLDVRGEHRCHAVAPPRWRAIFAASRNRGAARRFAPSWTPSRP